MRIFIFFKSALDATRPPIQCPQHIHKRFPKQEVLTLIKPLQEENRLLKEKMAGLPEGVEPGH